MVIPHDSMRGVMAWAMTNALVLKLLVVDDAVCADIGGHALMIVAAPPNQRRAQIISNPHRRHP